jgi:hypothetical protein
MVVRHRFAIAIAVAIAAPASAQCLTWSHDFGGNVGGTTFAVASLDGPDGPLLFAGGNLTSAGGPSVANVAVWNGQEWSAVAHTCNGDVHALAAFDDGTGPALYVGGNFTSIDGVSAAHIAKWDGASWSAVGAGTNGNVLALVAYDDGSGSSLYAGGTFTLAGATSVHNIARWSGSSWFDVGGGTDGAVRALASLVTASHRELAIGGTFQHAGGSPASNVAIWSSSTWSPLSSGVDNDVRTVAYYDDGSGRGRELYAAGLFLHAGGVSANRIAKWNGSVWSPLACGVDGEVNALDVYNSGSGSELYVGGAFNNTCVPTFRIARWNGTNWNSVAQGTAGGVTALCTYQDPVLGEHVLVAAGIKFQTWNGVQWRFPQRHFVSNSISALYPYTPPSGNPVLMAGGDIVTDGDQLGAQMWAMWNGSAWSTPNINHYLSPHYVNAFATFDDGNGPQLYVGGFFDAGTNGESNRAIFRFDGTNVTHLEPPFTPGFRTYGIGGIGEVKALAVFDDGSGSELYVGGEFDDAAGTSANLNNIAKWNGSRWAPLGLGVAPAPLHNPAVRCFATFDDGSGPALYAAGNFGLAGGNPANSIARWDGTNWSPLGGGVLYNGSPGADVRALQVFDDGTGPALYVGGFFTSAGGVPAHGLAKWNGSSWADVAPGSSLQVWSLKVFDDGSGIGPALYVGGYFTNVAGVPVSSLARFDGTHWTSVGGGTDVNGLVMSLAAYDQGADGTLDLFAGGDFTGVSDTIGGPVIASLSIAEWRACGPPGAPYCAGDGSLATPCPCNNFGASGRGCDNSIASGGALLASSGVTHPDSVRLTSSFELPSALSIFLQGDANAPAGIVFGDGLRCAAGHLHRLAAKNASGGVVHYPGFGELSITARSAQLGDPIAPGATRYYQVYYRDPALSFCPAPPGNSWNVGNAVSIAW